MDIDSKRIEQELNSIRNKPEPFRRTALERRDFMIWTTQAGDRILLKNMENSHLINAINYTKRRESSLAKNRILRVLQEEEIIREILHKEAINKKRQSNENK